MQRMGINDGVRPRVGQHQAQSSSSVMADSSANGVRPQVGQHQVPIYNPPSLLEASIKKIIDVRKEIEIEMPEWVMELIAEKMIRDNMFDNYWDKETGEDIISLLKEIHGSTPSLDFLKQGSIFNGKGFSVLHYCNIKDGLRYLNLNHCGIGDYSPSLGVIFRDYEKLEELHLRNNGLSDYSIILMLNPIKRGKGCRNLKKIDINENQNISWRMQKQLKEEMPQLELIDEKNPQKRSIFSLGQMLVERWIEAEENKKAQSLSNPFMMKFKRQFRL